MRLRGRINIAFVVIMIIPLALISLAFFVILKSRFSPVNPSTVGGGLITSIVNPISYINSLIADDYKELNTAVNYNNEKLSDTEYLDTVSRRLEDKYSYIYIVKDKKLVYSQNTELYDKIKEEILGYQSELTDISEYIEYDDFDIIVRYMSTKDKLTKVFLITNMAELELEAKLAWIQLFISIFISMLVTALTLSYWLNRSIERPIGTLRNFTKGIIDGDLDTEIDLNGEDEIGELYRDFDDMRKHLKKLLDENENKEKDMREIIVNMSHDIKTPLTAIKSYTEGLREGVANTREKQDKYLSTIYSKTVEMTSLIDELNTYARINNNDIPYNFAKIDINDYLEDGIQENRADLEINNIDIYFYPSGDEKLEVIADPEQFSRVFNNIVSNSKKYASKERNGKIDISVADLGEFVRIEVEDNGIGIDKENLPRIFDRLYRVDESRNSKVGGSGIGLAIVKKIVEEHSGEVWAESVKDKGTKIIVLLRNAAHTSVEKVAEARSRRKSLHI